MRENGLMVTCYKVTAIGGDSNNSSESHSRSSQGNNSRVTRVFVDVSYSSAKHSDQPTSSRRHPKSSMLERKWVALTVWGVCLPPMYSNMAAWNFHVYGHKSVLGYTQLCCRNIQSVWERYRICLRCLRVAENRLKGTIPTI